MDKTEVRVVIKYFCKKGMSLKEIHYDFIKTSSPYSTVKKWVAKFGRGGGGRAWRIMNHLDTLKRLLQMKMFSLCKVCSCMTGENSA